MAELIDPPNLLAGLEDDDVVLKDLVDSAEAAGAGPTGLEDDDEGGDGDGGERARLAERRARLEALNAQLEEQDAEAEGPESGGDEAEGAEGGEGEGDGEKKRKKKKKKKRPAEDGEDASDYEEEELKKKKKKKEGKKKRKDREGAEGESRRERRRRRKAEKKPKGADGPVASDDEEGVETQADRDFIEKDEEDDDDPRWGGGDSDDERRGKKAKKQRRRAEEAEEGEEAEEAGGKSKSKGGRAGGGGNKEDKQILATLDEDLKDMFKKMVQPRQKKSKDVQEEEANAQNIAHVFVKRMEHAAEEDERASKEGRPCMRKYMMLQEVSQELVKKHLQDHLLSEGLLVALKRWLEVLPDGSLPNVKIRTTVLQQLQHMRINLQDDMRRTQLKQSQLGQAVAFLSKCPDETPANRRLAGDLVTRWMQQLGVGASRGGAEATGRVKVGEVTPEERARQARAYEAEVQRKLREIQAAKPKVGDEEYRTRAQPPKATAFNFSVMPQSDVPEGRKEGKTEFQKRLGRRLAMIKKGRKEA